MPEGEADAMDLVDPEADVDEVEDDNVKQPFDPDDYEE